MSVTLEDKVAGLQHVVIVMRAAISKLAEALELQEADLLRADREQLQKRMKDLETAIVAEQLEKTGLSRELSYGAAMYALTLTAPIED